MKIPRAALNTPDLLNLPCFKFSGNLVTNAGRRMSPEELKGLFGFVALPVARAIAANAALFAQSEAVTDPHDDQLIIPETSFHCVPEPGAFTLIWGGEGKIQVNIGLFFLFVQMNRTIAWLTDFRKARNIPIDEILTMDIPSELIGEVKDVMQIWRGITRTGNFNITSISSSLTRDDPFSGTLQDMLAFAALHEFGHWYQVAIRPDQWDQLTRKTKNYLTSWLAEGEFASVESRQQISRLFAARPDIMTSWAEEVQSDILAVQNCEWYFRHSDDNPRAKQRVYIAQAMVYSLLVQLSEVFYESVLKKQVGWGSHPPAYHRMNIFCYIGSRELKFTSQTEFEVREWGIGSVIFAIMARLLDVVRSEY